MHDVVVVGGGPSGSTAARTAARRGLDTLLLDAASFPRNKPCGGGVSEEALGCLDFELPRSMAEADVFGARVHFLGRTVSARLDRRIAVVVSRSRFDHYLLDRAAEGGAEVRQGERVTAVVDEGDHVRVESPSGPHRARYCIVASGATGRLADAVRPRPGKDAYALAVELDVPAPEPAVTTFADGLVDIYFGIVSFGYGWIFPHAARFNVGLGALASVFPEAPRQLDAFCADLPGAVSDRLDDACNRVGHPIPMGGVNRTVAAGRVLLAGDAAGFVDAFYGEGIGYAIRSGQLAAQAVAGGRDPAATYASTVGEAVVRPLRYSLFITRLLHEHPLMLKLFASDPRVLRRFLEVPARQATYGQFLRWFLPRVPMLGARSLMRRRTR